MHGELKLDIEVLFKSQLEEIKKHDFTYPYLILPVL
jgi:hypothetical protein